MHLLLPLFYLLGAFPTGLMIAKAKGIDITKVGSGNVGATNIARNLGKKAGILTLIIDMLKGAIAPIIAMQVSNDQNFIQLAALMPVLGHCFSIPKLLRGGKGVATGLGVTLVIAPYAALISLVIFLLSIKFSKIVSLSSIIATLSIPIVNLCITKNTELSLTLLILAVVVIFKHRENIRKIIQGEEKRFSTKP